MKVNKKLLPMKMSYLLLFASLGPFIGFLPTIARQLGYSIITFGATMTAISIFSLIISPIVGVIVDKFRVKKLIMFTSIILNAISVFVFMYIPRITSKIDVELKCDSKITLFIYSENIQQSARNRSGFIDVNIDKLIMCKLDCQDMFYDDNINEFNNHYNASSHWKRTNFTKNPIERNKIDVEFKLNYAQQNQSSYIFNILSAYNNGIQIPLTTCQMHQKTICNIITCSNDAITELTKVTTYKGNVLYLYQFWIFFTLLCTFVACLTSFDTVLNSACLDLLGDKTEDYGKQKLWASIGWGGSSIFIGWLVDQISINAKEKNYAPVYYSFFLLSLCNVAVLTKIKVSESKKTKGKLKSVLQLFSKHTVIAFFIWVGLHRLIHTIITHFLFWYMEDLVSGNNDQSQRTWLKTLQGLAQGIQCLGGEIPFFFCSGLIIRKIGHVNCMALTLGTMAVRMYLYTAVWNPAWIILIELLNGISFALGVAVKMSYAKLISPPETTNTIIGLLGLFDGIGDSIGSVLGGYLYESYGGVWTFRFFACGSAIMCVLNLLGYYFGFIKELKNNNFTAVPTEINTKDAITTEDH